jgi:hypothetical protein
VRVTCPCGASPHRAGSARADRREVGDTGVPRGPNALLELPQESRGSRRSGEAQAAGWRAVAAQVARGRRHHSVSSALARICQIGTAAPTATENNTKDETHEPAPLMSGEGGSGYFPPETSANSQPERATIRP